MRTLLCLFFIITSTFALTVASSKTYSSASGTGNYMGAGVTNEMITAFIESANTASGFFRYEPNPNALYIKQQMDDRFGTSTQNFFVVIITEKSKLSWFTRITNNNVIAKLEGVNQSYPDWQYLFIRFIAPNQGQGYVYVSQYTVGEGITTSIEDLIRSVVNKNESGDICSCNVTETSSIGKAVNSGTGAKWSTICDSEGAVSAYVNTVGGKWISVQPKKCWYTFYVSQ